MSYIGLLILRKIFIQQGIKRMDPDISRDTLLKQLNGEWLKNIENELYTQLDKDAQQLKELLKLSLERLKKGESEKAFNDLLLKIKPTEKSSDEEDANTGKDSPVPWLEAVNNIAEELPESIELVQEEERFKSIKDDRFLVRTNKFVKRAWRGYLAGLSKLFRSNENDPSQDWKQTVPVRSIVKFHFLDLDEWIRSWDNELRRIECNILLEVEARILHSNNLFQLINEQKGDGDEVNNVDEDKSDDQRLTVPNEEDIEIFFEKAIEEVDNILKAHKGYLKDSLRQKQDKISNAFSLVGTIEMSGDDFSYI
jgi:hypothetical protein